MVGTFKKREFKLKQLDLDNTVFKCQTFSYNIELAQTFKF